MGIAIVICLAFSIWAASIASSCRGCEAGAGAVVMWFESWPTMVAVVFDPTRQ